MDRHRGGGQSIGSAGGKWMDALSLIAPLAAGVASSYGGGYAQGAGVALAGFRDFQRRQGNKALGKTAVALADTMADRDLAIRTKRWDQDKPKEKDYVRKEDLKHVSNVEDDSWNKGDPDFVGTPTLQAMDSAPHLDTAKKNVKKSKEAHQFSLTNYLESMPEPERDEGYRMAAELVANDPQRGLAMLSDREQSIQSMEELFTETQNKKAALSMQQLTDSMRQEEERQFTTESNRLSQQSAMDRLVAQQDGLDARSEADRLSREKVSAGRNAVTMSQIQETAKTRGMVEVGNRLQNANIEMTRLQKVMADAQENMDQETWALAKARFDGYAVQRDADLKALGLGTSEVTVTPEQLAAAEAEMAAARQQAPPPDDSTSSLTSSGLSALNESVPIKGLVMGSDDERLDAVMKLFGNAWKHSPMGVTNSTVAVLSEKLGIEPMTLKSIIEQMKNVKQNQNPTQVNL